MGNSRIIIFVRGGGRGEGGEGLKRTLARKARNYCVRVCAWWMRSPLHYVCWETRWTTLQGAVCLILTIGLISSFRYPYTHHSFTHHWFLLNEYFVFTCRSSWKRCFCLVATCHPCTEHANHNNDARKSVQCTPSRVQRETPPLN